MISGSGRSDSGIGDTRSSIGSITGGSCSGVSGSSSTGDGGRGSRDSFSDGSGRAVGSNDIGSDSRWCSSDSGSDDDGGGGSISDRSGNSAR